MGSVPVQQTDDELSPAERLPPEVLGKIFLEVNLPPSSLHDLFAGETWSITRCMNWIRVCTHVYHRWRMAAISFPKLWSYFSVRQYTPSQKEQVARYVSLIREQLKARSSGEPDLTERRAQVAPLVRMHLERSKTHPLCVIDVANLQEPRAHPVLLELISEAHRWHRVALRLREDDLQALDSTKDRLTTLEQVYLSVSQRFKAPNSYDLSDFLAAAPCLRDATLPFPAKYNIKWSQLTKLSVELDSRALQVASHIVNVLQQAVSLEDLHLQYRDKILAWFASPMDGITPVQVPSVRSLSCSTYMLPLLTLPSLSVLALNIGRRRSDVSPIGAFLARSRCSIHTLRISDGSIRNTPTDSAILALIPDITTLRLTTTSSSTIAFINALTLSPERRICPDLHTPTITLIHWQTQTITQAAVQMVTSRMGRLRNLHFYYWLDEDQTTSSSYQTGIEMTNAVEDCQRALNEVAPNMGVEIKFTKEIYPFDG